MADITIISRPKPPEDDADAPVRVISRPAEPMGETTVTARQDAPPEPYVPEGGFFDRAKQNYMRDVNEGVGRMQKPGVFNKAVGGLGYAMAPLNAAGKTLVGDPLALLTGELGGGDTAQRFMGELGTVGSQVFGGAPVAKGIQGAVDAASHINPESVAKAADAVVQHINKGATAVGGGLRSTVDAVEDLVKQRMAGSARTAAEKAATAPATADELYDAAGKGFERAKTTGGELPPNSFGEFVNGNGKQDADAVAALRDRLASHDVSVADDPELFKNTGDMLKALERRVEGGSVQSFADLMKLQRSLRGYVRKAKAAGVREGDDSDLRGATILKHELDDFMSKAGEGSGATGELANAKELWKRASKMEDVEDVMDKAARLKDPDLLKKSFRSLALDNYAMNNFTEAERKLVDKLGADSLTDDLPGVLTGDLRKVAKVASMFDRRMAIAKELKDLIARGEDAQKASAAEKAAQPSWSRRTMDAVGNLSDPGQPRRVEVIDVPGLRK